MLPIDAVTVAACSVGAAMTLDAKSNAGLVTLSF